MGLEIMVQLGGFAPQPINDQWATEDGNEWVYCGYAEWGPRGFHKTTTFEGQLYVMGGTPLNNEVWRLDSVEKIYRTEIPSNSQGLGWVDLPLTRVGFVNYTYNFTWTLMGNADWSPRVGFGLVTHMFYNASIAKWRWRMVVLGGFGGTLGVQTMSAKDDVWVSDDAVSWTMIQEHANFGPRAWFALGIWHDPDDVTRDVTTSARGAPPRMWLFGGGDIGTTPDGKVYQEMFTHADSYWSRDGVDWVRINFEEGGGSSFVKFYSSERWAKTVVDGRVEYIGLWGSSLEYFEGLNNPNFYLIGGAYGGKGSFSSAVFAAKNGLFCDINGVTCNGKGICSNYTTGCVCEQLGSLPTDFDDEYCAPIGEDETEEIVQEDVICFAGDEVVLLESGHSMLIQDVQVGNRILASSRAGELSFSTVIAVPHKKNKYKAEFVEISTSSGHQVRMSVRHLLLAGQCDQKGFSLLPATMVDVGTCVITQDGKAEQVISSSRVVGTGIYSLVAEEELVVVGGIVASPFAVNHAIPSTFYDTYRLIYKFFPDLFRYVWFKNAHGYFSDVLIALDISHFL